MNEILKAAGWPTNLMVIDFETYFDTEYTLSKMATCCYVDDPRFQAIGVGVNRIVDANPDQQNMAFYWNDDDDLTRQRLADAPRFTVVMQNARFDALVLKEHYGIECPYIIDVRDLASHLDSRMSHRLRDMAKLFKLSPKGDTLQFKDLRKENFTPEQRDAMARYCITDISLETELFFKLLPFLTDPEQELWLGRHTLEMYLNPRLQFDAGLGKRLAAQMRIELERKLRGLGLTMTQINSDIQFTKILLDHGAQLAMKPGKPTKNMRKLLGEYGYPDSGVIPAYAQTDDGFKALLYHTNPTISAIAEARVAANTWPKHIKRINNMRAQSDATPGGALRIPLNYYGGHTGRWSGGEKINVQNMGGRGRAGKGTHDLVRAMRGLVRAPQGSTLVLCDSSQIEARVLAWLAGEKKLIEGFRNNEDIYSEFATTLFRSRVRKTTGADPPAVKKMLDIRRGFGKDAILGCGYGMGAIKFYSRCRENEALRPVFDSGVYDASFIDKLIRLYRSTYPRIPGLWRQVENAFRSVLAFPRYVALIPGQAPSVSNQPMDNAPGCLTFSKSGSLASIRLPSDRVLYYRNAVVDKNDQVRDRYGPLWGGSLVENIVQAVARDLLGWWVRECEKWGLPVVMHVHDEVIVVTPDANAKNAEALALQIMRSLPPWAAGLPVDAEAKISEVYTK